MGTDFNEGVKGMGPKTALKLIKSHGDLEGLPEKYREHLPKNTEELREIFLRPRVTDEYEIRFKGLDEAGLRNFLCGERGFSPERVELAIDRMRGFYSREHSSLKSWMPPESGGS